MKTTLKTLILTAVAASLVTVVSAAPPGKDIGTFRKASTQEGIQKLKKGHRYAMVCMDCKSITVKEVADEKEVMALCHNGGSVHCDACKKKATIKHVGVPGKGTDRTEVTIVNAKGKPCMFIVPMKK